MGRDDRRFDTVLFDLDGTLLPMDQDEFVHAYFRTLATTMASLGYEPRELVDCVWAGTKAMARNDGGRSNAEVFWEAFADVCGPRVLDDVGAFDSFYANEFAQVRSSCGYNPQAAASVRAIKASGMRVALATNPIFPATATEARVRWAGLEPDDFELVTTYENSGYCKPNVRYFDDVARRLGCVPERTLMVGNDVAEDMVAEQTGMRVFLLTDCLINREDADISDYPQGSFAELMGFVGV